MEKNLETNVNQEKKTVNKYYDYYGYRVREKFLFDPDCDHGPGPCWWIFIYVSNNHGMTASKGFARGWVTASQSMQYVARLMTPISVDVVDELISCLRGECEHNYWVRATTKVDLEG